MTSKFVVWFSEVDKGDINIVGGKGANLGEMTKAGFPVPDGFIVTAQAYYHFLDVTHLRDQIHSILSGIDVNDSLALEKASKAIEKVFMHTEFPKDISEQILKAYFKLDVGLVTHALVAVRSSATAEDLPNASFAGQQATYLNVQGEANVIEKVKEAWASLFTARAIFYRATNNFDHFKVGIAIPVQKMVHSEASGVMFTIDPVTSDKSKVVIEAIYGLGEMIVQGAVTPDHYEVDKKSKGITVKKVNPQEKKMVKKGHKNAILPLTKAEALRQKIPDEQILKVAELGLKLEEHYFFPQDVEWAVEKGQVYIVQTRPITTVGKMATTTQTVNADAQLIVRGDPASPGVAAGPVKILTSAREIDKIQRGDVLVAEQTNPDFVPAMKRAVAILTERGGRTSHAAIVSRELGIPAIVGAAGIMKLVKDGIAVTVNGSTGEVFKGSVVSSMKPVEVKHYEHAHEKTATNVYINIAEPERAPVIAKLNVDGVGLLRAEFMAAQIGVHPRKFIADKRENEFVDRMAEGVETICKAFFPRPVVYRATDFKTNEFRNLKGGDLYEPKEENPMLGFRGAARYVADPKVFELELEMIKKVRREKQLSNLSLMIPFVRSPGELAAVKKIVTAQGLTQEPTFKLWMMVELPTNVISIESFLDVGINGISIGSNDLTMLILGTDRDNSEVAKEFNELDPSVLWAFERVITACKKRNVTTSMCGQAPSDYPELVEKLVNWGITSISINPDVVEHVRNTVYEAERKTLSVKQGETGSV